MDKKKLCFIHIPRTGGTVISRYLKTVYKDQVDYFTHSRVSDITDIDQYYTSAFVRNPWDWHVSRYFYYRRSWTVEQGVSIKCDSGLTWQGFEKKFPTLGSYLRWGDGECDKFWMIDRYNDMCYTDGISAIDVFGKFENIEQSLFDVLRVCSISTKGKKTYSGYIKDEIKARGNDERRIAEMFNVSHHDHYSSYYYDEELIELVRQRERPLIESFGYSFETSCNRIYPYD